MSNTQVQTQAQAQDDICRRAASAFMLIQISISTWDGVKLNKSATAQAAQGAGASDGVGRLYVNLLGQHHRELKSVKAHYAAIRDYLYANTLPFAAPGDGQQRRGDRLVAVNKVPEVLAELARRTDEARQVLQQFLLRYDELVHIARSRDLGTWQDGIAYPTLDEVRQRFAITVQPPQPLQIARVEDMPALPANIAAEIAAQHSQNAARMLASAKDEALASAQDHVDRLHKQLTEGKRFHKSLLDATLRHADMLDSIARGTDNDPRLVESARILREQCANVPTVDGWKNSETKREEAATATGTVREALKALGEERSAQSQPVPTGTVANGADAADGVQIGGMLADLW